MGGQHLDTMSRAEREAFLLGATTLFDEAMCSLQPEVSIMLKEWLDDLADWRNGPAPLPPSQWASDAPAEAIQPSAGTYDSGLHVSEHLARHCDRHVAAARARDAVENGARLSDDHHIHRQPPHAIAG